MAEGKHYPWGQCIYDMTHSRKKKSGKGMTKSYDLATARKICGNIKAHSSLQSFNKGKEAGSAREAAGFFVPDDFDIDDFIEQNKLADDYLSNEEQEDIVVNLDKSIPVKTCPHCGRAVRNHHGRGYGPGPGLCASERFKACVGVCTEKGASYEQAYGVCNDSLDMPITTKEMNHAEQALSSLGLYLDLPEISNKPRNVMSEAQKLERKVRAAWMMQYNNTPWYIAEVQDNIVIAKYGELTQAFPYRLVDNYVVFDAPYLVKKTFVPEG